MLALGPILVSLALLVPLRAHAQEPAVDAGAPTEPESEPPSATEPTPETPQPSTPPSTSPSSSPGWVPPTAPEPPRAYVDPYPPSGLTLGDEDVDDHIPLPIAGEAEERAEPVAPPEERPPASVEHVFYLPTARSSGPGVSGEYVSALGWFGLRVGIGDRVDVGIGLPFYLSGVSVDARVAVVSNESFAVAMYGYTTIPVNDEEGVDFSTGATGIAYAIGPTAGLWGDEASVHAGIHLAGRTARGGLWLLAHSSLELKITRLVSALVSGVALVELAAEDDAPIDTRTFPYVAAGARIGGRSFAVDCGVLVPLDRNAPGSLSRLPLTPILAMGHRW